MAELNRPSSRLAAGRGLLIPGVLVMAWLLLVDAGRVQSPLLVPLTEIVSAPFIDPAGRQLWAALAASLLRLSVGFLIGTGLGVSLGILLGMLRPLQLGVAPTVHALRQIATFAWIPLITAWFGTSELAKVFFIALSAFFPALVNTEQGVRSVPRALREVAAVLQLPFYKRVCRLMLPAALPSILIGVEISLITAWIGTVGAEYAVGVGRGLGSFLVAAREVFRMELVLAGVLLLALVGYGLSRFSRFLFQRFLPWQVL